MKAKEKQKVKKEKNKNVFFIYFLDINCLDVFKIYIF